MNSDRLDTQNAPDYCGCCGREITQDTTEWCMDCLREHIDTTARNPWDATYYAQHGVDCPYYSQDRDTEPEASQRDDALRVD